MRPTATTEKTAEQTCRGFNGIVQRFPSETNRDNAGLATLDNLHCWPMQISEFQALMDELYGQADSERGLPASVAWLCEEVGELAQAIRKGTTEEQLHELGDVLAWLCSIANQLGLSMEEAARRYETSPP